MRISVEQYQSRIGFHNHFVKAKDALSCFKAQLKNRVVKVKYFNKVDKGQFMPLRFLLSASGFLQILSTLVPVQHKEENRDG